MAISGSSYTSSLAELVADNSRSQSVGGSSSTAPDLIRIELISESSGQEFAFTLYRYDWLFIFLKVAAKDRYVKLSSVSEDGSPVTLITTFLDINVGLYPEGEITDLITGVSFPYTVSEPWLDACLLILNSDQNKSRVMAAISDLIDSSYLNPSLMHEVANLTFSIPYVSEGENRSNISQRCIEILSSMLTDDALDAINKIVRRYEYVYQTNRHEKSAVRYYFEDILQTTAANELIFRLLSRKAVRAAPLPVADDAAVPDFKL